jgi:hypothetical protein
MPADAEPPHESHSSDVAFLLPIVARLGVDQVCRLAYRAGQILAAAASAHAAADAGHGAGDQVAMIRPVPTL